MTSEAVPVDEFDDGIDRWWLRAACRPDPDWSAEQVREHVELFYPDRGEATAPAKAFCEVCPVRSQCLEDALDSVDKNGIWGGLSERQRRRTRRGAGVRRDRLTHGTAAGFDKGCDCGACRVAANARRTLETQTEDARARALETAAMEGADGGNT